ncbi:putative nuclease HARBI1 [Prorops nasuta]|uniref:putative nuclease HARBI1 n=1 Tax=Prorops nasuta TaxID=863751 RepID=UPI0034CD978D
MNIVNRSLLEWINDDDDDDDLQPILRRKIILRARINWYNIYDDIDFIKRFRIRKEQVSLLLRKIGNSLLRRTVCNQEISPLIQILVALRFYASGSFFIAIGDFIGISKTSAIRIVHNVSAVIASLSREYIKFPSTSDDILKTQAGIFNKAGFIRILGAIDCIHIKIQSNGGENAELFRNRKGFFSFNVQVIVNSKLQILDIVVRWPGSCHDATIFNNSAIKGRFEAGEFGNGMLLGDSGYPNLPYVMTPLLHPNTPAEILYNESQIRTRSMVERCFGIWTRIFPILSLGSRFRTPQRTMDMIMACAILYNIIRSDVEEVIDCDSYNNILLNYNEILHKNERQYLIENYFERCV